MIEQRRQLPSFRDDGLDEPADPDGTVEAAAGNASEEAVKPETTPPDDDAPEPATGAETPAEESEAAEDNPAAAEKPGTEPATAEKPPVGEEKPAAPAPSRPSWVGAEPQQTGDGYRMSILVGPYVRRSECDAALPAELQRAAADYIAHYLSPKAARRVRLSPNYVRDNIVKERWEEKVANPLDPKIRVLLEPEEKGPMTQLHALLQFDHKVNARLDELWQRAIVTERLWYLGTAVVTALALLCVLFTGLKVDLTTGGTCRGRLSVAGVAAVVLVVAGAWMLLECAPPYPLAPYPAAPDPLTIIPSSFSTEHASHGRSAAGRVGIGPWAAILPIGLFLLAAFAGLMVLILNKKTRAAGLVLLAIAGLGGLVVGSRVFDVFPMSVGPVEVIITAAATLYIILLTVLSRSRWLWILGMLVCFILAALLTPPDPLSMLLIVVLLCVLYTIGVFAWKAGRKSPGAEMQP